MISSRWKIKAVKSTHREMGAEETATDELAQVGFSEELILELKPI